MQWLLGAVVGAITVGLGYMGINLAGKTEALHETLRVGEPVVIEGAVSSSEPTVGISDGQIESSEDQDPLPETENSHEHEPDAEFGKASGSDEGGSASIFASFAGLAASANSLNSPDSQGADESSTGADVTRASNAVTEADKVEEGEEIPDEANNSEETPDEASTEIPAPKILSGEQTHVEVDETAREETAVTEEELIYPENITLLVSESAEHRMGMDEVNNLPAQVAFAVWPDSVITTSGRPFYLMSPPVDIMNSYKLRDIVADENDLYQKTFPLSLGIYAHQLDFLAENNELSKLIYAQIAEKNKSLILFNAYVDPELNELLKETQVDFQQVDYVFDQDSSEVTVDAQWQAILTKASHGEEIMVLYEMDEAGIEPLIKALNQVDELDQ